MKSQWEMPAWMHQYADLVTDTGDDGVEGTMNLYKHGAADLIETQEGRCVAVNAQVGLLVGLHARGMLVDVEPCPLRPKTTFGCSDCERFFTAEEALEHVMQCDCGGKIQSIIPEDGDE